MSSRAALSFVASPRWSPSSSSPSSSTARRRRRGSKLSASSGKKSDDGATTTTSTSTTPEAFRDLERSLEALAELTKGAEDRGWFKVDDSWVFDPSRVSKRSGDDDDDNGRAKESDASSSKEEEEEKEALNVDARGETSSSSSSSSSSAKATCVCHFIGGAFVGASPQLTYRVFLEKLAKRASCVVVATPYELSFDHLRVVDDCQFKFDRAFAKLDADLQTLPVVSIGHSMGAHVHALINSRYELNREALVLISYNNKPATDAVPLFAEVFVPGLSAISPVLQPLAASPLREGLRDVDRNVRSFAPEAVKELLTVVDQLEPLLLDVSNGRKEFQPTPEEAKELIKKYYSGPNTLLIKFRDDTIDETAV